MFEAHKILIIFTLSILIANGAYSQTITIPETYVLYLQYPRELESTTISTHKDLVLNGAVYANCSLVDSENYCDHLNFVNIALEHRNKYFSINSKVYELTSTLVLDGKMIEAENASLSFSNRLSDIPLKFKEDFLLKLRLKKTNMKSARTNIYGEDTVLNINLFSM